MTFAQKMRQLRDTKGLSEAGLAETSGVAFGALHFYALGRRKPSFAAVVKIARALGVTCEAFADCEDIAVEQADSAPAARPRREQAVPGTPPGSELEAEGRKRHNQKEPAEAPPPAKPARARKGK